MEGEKRLKEARCQVIAGQDEGPSAAETAVTRRNSKSKIENNRWKAFF
jgi:hypothetical protein